MVLPDYGRWPCFTPATPRDAGPVSVDALSASAHVPALPGRWPLSHSCYCL